MSDASARSPWRRPLLLAAAWLLIGELLIPGLISLLYHSDWAAGWDVIARAKARHPLAHYLGAWRKDARWAVAALLGYQALALASRSPRFAERFVPAATPGMLGAIRALVAGVLLASTLWEHLPSTALLPREMIHGAGVLRVLYALPVGFDRFAASPAALTTFQAATALVLACAMLGYRTRLTVPLAALAYLMLGGIPRQYAWFYHTGLVPLYLLAVLSFTPCGDGFSLDRRLRARRSEPVPDARVANAAYGWGRYLAWTAFALPYVEAGLSKLRRGGLGWMEPSNLKAILLTDTLNPMQFDWGIALQLVSAPDALFFAIGGGTILGEVAFGLVLFSRRGRLVLPLVMLGMHLGIWLLQNVLFFDLMILQAVFYDWSPAIGWLRERLERTRTVRLQSAALAGSLPTPIDGPRRLRALAGLLILCWAIRIEEYPFTAMQMYSKPNHSGVIEWYAVLATYESGAVGKAPIEQVFPALRDARYRRAIRRGFETDGRPVADAFLRALATTHNARAAPGSRITALEVQRWRWDFARDPRDPDHGELDARFELRAEPLAASQ